MDFGERLRNIRLERNMTQQNLADAIGVSVVAVRYWEGNVKKPSMNALIAIAKTLQVSADVLLGVPVATQHSADIILSPSEKSIVLDYRALDTYGKKAVRTICSLEKERIQQEENACMLYKTVKKKMDTHGKKRDRYIPRYTTPSAAGYSVPLGGSDFEMLLVDESVPPQADFAVNIEGNSMYPYIKDGDMVYVQKNAKLSIGDVGIFCVDGAMYCKQYYIDDEHNLILVSANPRLRHTNVFVGAESGNSVICYGKVLLPGTHLKLPDYLFEEE